MKKYSLLIAIGVVTLVFMLLSWIIPAGSFIEGVFSDSLGHRPMGLFSIVLAPLWFFNSGTMHILPHESGIMTYNYANILLAFLTIGVLYKVLDKTGAYGNLIDDFTKFLKNRKTAFITFTTLFFVVFSSLTGLTLLLFLLMPFFVTVILKLKYTKITAFSATILAILVGRICAISAHDITGISNQIYGFTSSTDITIKITLLIILSALLLLFVHKTKSEAKEKIEDPIIEGKIKTDKSYTPIIILLSLFIVILAVMMFNWNYVFNMTFITDAYNNLINTTIGNYPIGTTIFGMIEPFGYWTGFTMSAMLIILSIIIGFIYSIKFDELVDSVKTGIVSMGRVCIYIILAFTVMTFLIYTGHTFIVTVANFIFENINSNAVPFAAVASGIVGVFTSDFTAISTQLLGVLGEFFDGESLSLAVLTTQVVSGTVAVIAPTSIFLVAGLAYLDIPYKDWLKHIWKLFLILLIISLVILLIISIF